jgi:protease-4
MNKKFIWLLIIFFFLILIGLLTFSFFIFNIAPGQARVESNSFLEIKLEGRLEDYTPFISFMGFFQEKTICLYDTWMNLRKAGVDPRIKAVVLKFGSVNSDWAKIEELRQAVFDFRKSGKPVLAYFEESPDADKEYYLATACDRIILHPLGWVGVNGLASYVPFFRGTLDKLGIKAEFEHIEEYKTAYNQFTEKGFTPAHKEMMESIYRDIYDYYFQRITEARKKTPEEMQKIIDHGYFQGKEAVSSGLMDGLAYEDQLIDLMNLKEVHKLNKISNEKYASVKPSSLGLNQGKKIALIFATGTILTGEEQIVALGSETFARWLRSAARDKTISAIVVRVDSPGGSAVGSDIIWHELVRIRSEKPVVISMSGLAGSGGYWISLGGHKIISQPQTLTGSIGVIAGKFSFENLMDKLGIKTEKIVFGREADAFSIYRAFTPEEKKILKNQIQAIYEQFLERVASSRNIPVEEVDRIGRGRVWTGHQAKELNLVDELGGLSLAIESAKKIAGISAEEEVKLVLWPKKRTLLDLLMGKETELSYLVKQARLISGYMRLMEFFGQPRIWSLMPAWLY